MAPRSGPAPPSPPANRPVVLEAQPGLLVRVARRVCVLPLGDVIEVMRPQPLVALAGAPDYVRGLAVLRGAATPVLDLAALLDGRPSAAPRRLVLVRAGARRVALAVTEAIGVRGSLPASEALPPLVRDAALALEAVGTIDHELMLVLAAARLVPEAQWRSLDIEFEVEP